MQVIPADSTHALSQFEQAVDQLEVCAPAPAVALRVLALLRDGRSSRRELEHVLGVDGGLVTRVLRLASTPAFAARQVANLGFAVQVLGDDQLRRLVLTAQLAGHGTEFTRALWAYALRIACTCEALAPRFVVPPVADPFLCGLLHDVGTMALEHFIGRGYATSGFAPGDDHQVELEHEAFGFDHADLGAMVAARWDLFPELELVAQLHHQPFAADALALPATTLAAVAVVALARVVGRADDDPARALRDALCARHGVAVDVAEACGVAGAAAALDLVAALA